MNSVKSDEQVLYTRDIEENLTLLALIYLLFDYSGLEA